MITELDKQIIEIIEPYMPKDLSEGCIFTEKFHWVNSNDLVWNKIVSRYTKGDVDLMHYTADYSEGTHLHFIGVDWILNFRQKKHGDEHKQDGEFVYKILGHYDITAVLKYIVKEGGTWEWNCVFVDRISVEFYGEHYQIPNKPLHLYTEEEKQSLLELLKTLGTNKKNLDSAPTI